MQQVVQEGKPNVTLLKYDDPIESTVPTEKTDSKETTKGVGVIVNVSSLAEESGVTSLRVKAH